MNSCKDIFTARLRLITITPDLMHIEAAILRELLRVEVPSCWPPEHWEPHVFDFMKQHFRQAPKAATWTRYVVLRAEAPVLIGTVGGFLRTETEAEVGYGILPPWQRQGLATEGTLALMDLIFQDDLIESISAQTYLHLTASLRVMEKCGFAPAGEGDEPGTVRYRLTRPMPSPAATPDLTRPRPA